MFRKVFTKRNFRSEQFSSPNTKKTAIFVPPVYLGEIRKGNFYIPPSPPKFPWGFEYGQKTAQLPTSPADSRLKEHKDSIVGHKSKLLFQICWKKVKSDSRAFLLTFYS
jgi:hypothetical protein